MNFVLDLPNELWLTVFSYLNTVDLFQSFENINQRFNNLLYGNLQNLILPNDVTNPWLIRILPLITKPIQTLSCDECSLTFIWNHLHYFSQIQSVNLHGNDWTMSMKLFDQPLSLVLISSLKYLFSVTPWNVRLSAETLTRINSQTHVEYRERMSMIQSFTDEVNEDDLCPFVIRLSVQVVYSPILFRICTRARNLRHLQIHYNHFGFGDESAVPKFHLSIQRASLRILQITSRHNRNLNVFDKFVRWFDQSLEKFILDVDCIDSIDGNLLQSLCQPFVRLKRFRFFIENPIKNLEEYFQSFESQWWRRFPVYIQKKTNNLSIVATIPVLRAFDFENGFYNWLINGDLHSPRIEFNSKKIHFLNTKSQLIDLKDLDFIDRIFSSFDQVLSFNYPYLHTPDLVYQLLIDGTMKPILGKVKQFVVKADWAIDALDLSVWILLMPNLKILDISQINYYSKGYLIEYLGEKIEEDQRLHEAFHRIEQVILFSKFDRYQMEKILRNSQKIFLNAVIV